MVNKNSRIKYDYYSYIPPILLNEVSCDKQHVLDDFTEWLPSQLVRYNNILLAGHFNIHMNKATIDDKPALFVSTIEAMGFQVELIDQGT